ncbi:MAG: hypothetical protein UZ13_01104 [Chloroflexi bacterium OLB13]|nr:MAG: hypothetical protein UZ13_01104 [Chloroflexi bacterium OLB13]
MSLHPAIQRAAAGIVVLHAAIGFLHAMTHLLIPVPLDLWGYVYVALVIGVAPLLGVWLMRPPHVRLGAWLLLVGMAGALVFGLLEHFMLPGADNIAHVSSGVWQGTFQWTAAALLVIEALGTLVGLIAVQPRLMKKGAQ